MSSEGRAVRLSSLFSWAQFGTPFATLAVVSLLVLIPSEPPGVVYLVSDPVALPLISLSLAGMSLVGGIFTGFPFTPRPPPGTPAPSARWALRVGLAVLVVLSFFALRFPIIHSARPTREAVELLRRHAVAGKKIGAPITVGWAVRGWIHASGEVNDEPVPARIDASVPVSGPRGAGVLAIEGHEEGDRWVFDRVWLEPEHGQRIDIVGVPARDKKNEDGGVDPQTIGLIGGLVLFAAILALGLGATLRGSDPARAVATVEATSGAPAALRFTTSALAKHRLWLRFEIDYDGGEDDYGVTVEARIQVGSGTPSHVEHRIGDRAPELGPSATRNTTLHRVSHSSGPSGGSIRATSNIAALPAAPPGTEIRIDARVVVAEGQKPVGLLLYVVPA